MTRQCGHEAQRFGQTTRTRSVGRCGRCRPANAATERCYGEPWLVKEQLKGSLSGWLTNHSCNSCSLSGDLGHGLTITIPPGPAVWLQLHAQKLSQQGSEQDTQQQQRSWQQGQPTNRPTSQPFAVVSAVVWVMLSGFCFWFLLLVATGQPTS